MAEFNGLTAEQELERENAMCKAWEDLQELAMWYMEDSISKGIDW